MLRIVTLAALGLSLEGGRSAYGELSADQLVAAADWWWVARVEPQPLDALMAAPSLQSDSPAEELSAPATDSPAQRNEGN